MFTVLLNLSSRISPAIVGKKKKVTLSEDEKEVFVIPQKKKKIRSLIVNLQLLFASKQENFIFTCKGYCFPLIDLKLKEKFHI